MIRMMRLKHLSLNTERTYLGWLRSFYKFINGQLYDLYTNRYAALCASMSFVCSRPRPNLTNYFNLMKNIKPGMGGMKPAE